MNHPTMKRRRWNREEYDRAIEAGVFQPGDRLQLIEGEIITLTPQGSRHATTIPLVEGALRKIFDARFHIRIQTPLALGEWSEPEPDIAIVPGSPRDYRDRHPTTAILVVEVSDATLKLDRE